MIWAAIAILAILIVVFAEIRRHILSKSVIKATCVFTLFAYIHETICIRDGHFSYDPDKILFFVGLVPIEGLIMYLCVVPYIALIFMFWRKNGIR